MEITDSAAPKTSSRRGLLDLNRFVQIVVGERVFLLLLLIGTVTAALSYQTPWLAMWVGFAFAGYSAVANDSVQTIGTFIASNRDRKWWVLWIFIGGIFLATVAYSWLTHQGDVTYGRLASKGFENAPTSFSFLQVAAPLVLLVLTRLRMPVSTTFLLLTSFAADASSVGSVLGKSLLGYVVAFVASGVVWLLMSKAFDRWFKGKPHPMWRVAQWLTTGGLWSVWIMQDAANVAVYLPRQLEFWQFGIFGLVIFGGLGVLFKMGGEKIQQVVDEKSGVIDVRAATAVDFVYALVLFYFKGVSAIPMSTTWVFIGLLGGRELAMAARGTSQFNVKTALKMLGRDMAYAGAGLLISLIIAYAVNESFQEGIHNMLGLGS